MAQRLSTQENCAIRYRDPKSSLQICGSRLGRCWSEFSPTALITVYIIESLHPDGWRTQGSAKLEYWACQEAQSRCCSDGRNYRIIDAGRNEIVALIDISSCRLVHAPSC